MTFSERVRMLARLWKYRLREERESIAFMRRQPLAGCTVLDIGANKGIYAYWMSRQAGPTGRVIAFEPQPELRPHLDDLKQTFRLDNLQIVGEGLSNRRGTAPMRRDKPGSLGATLAAEHAEAVAGGLHESVDVEVTTLDDYCAASNIGPVRFIKCDVEGHELAVFEGARRMLGEHQPLLLLECHHREAERGELFRFLSGLGYEGFFCHGKTAISWARFRDYPYRKPSVQFRNYMFAHPAAPAAW